LSNAYIIALYTYGCVTIDRVSNLNHVLKTVRICDYVNAVRQTRV